jgi:hypothetical protein
MQIWYHQSFQMVANIWTFCENTNCCWSSNNQEGEVRVGIPITDLTLPHIGVCLKSGHGFPLAYVVVFIAFHDLRWEVIVHFVDIDGVVCHHYLNALFIIQQCWLLCDRVPSDCKEPNIVTVSSNKYSY